MNWKEVVDERLIAQGMLIILDLNFFQSYQDDLKALNKVGAPFKITDTYIQFLAIIYFLLFSMPYRQLEGFICALSKLIPQLPPIMKAYQQACARY